jgi:RNA polymerase sigma-70 factor (ECF subfamily)
MENIDKSFDFEEIYLSWFQKLKRFAKEYIISEADAENIVQDVFIELWEKKLFFADRICLTAYLFTSVKNKSLNCLRRRITEQDAADHIRSEYRIALRMNLDSLKFFDHSQFDELDIEEIISKAINSLSEKCRRIFIMSKIEGKKQKDIAAELNISINTVETQMGIAYKKLKQELKNYFPLFMFILIL